MQILQLQHQRENTKPSKMLTHTTVKAQCRAPRARNACNKESGAECPKRHSRISYGVQGMPSNMIPKPAMKQMSITVSPSEDPQEPLPQLQFQPASSDLELD